jgi:6-phosphogluconolactonase
MHDWQILPESDAVAHAAAELIAARIRAVTARKGQCHVALPGGTTPAACLRLLAAMKLPWDAIHWYLGDERCLPVGDAERNDSMIRDCLWSRAPIPASHCHSVPAELGPQAAAEAYSRVMAEVGTLDIVLLGMGEDGHTASLFPGNPALQLDTPAVPVFDAPKPPPERVSLSIPTLQAAAQRIVLITGAGKREAVEQMRAGEPLPINRVGDLLCLADQAAAG